MDERSSSEQSERARQYLLDNDISTVFESLMVGLMSHMPDDPVQFMIECLRTIKTYNKGQAIKWDMFVDDLPYKSHQTPDQKVQESPRDDPKFICQNVETATLSSPSKRDDVDTVQMEQKEKEQLVADVAEETVADVLKEVNNQCAPGPEQFSPVPVAVLMLIGCTGTGKSQIVENVVGQMGESRLHLVNVSAVPKVYADRLNDADVLALNSGNYVSDETVNNFVLEQVRAAPDRCQLVLVSGYPLTQGQLDFAKSRLNIKMAALLDYPASEIEKHVIEAKTGIDTDASKNRINEFTCKTLPVAKALEEENLLQIIPGEIGTEAIESALELLLRGFLDDSGVSLQATVAVDESAVSQQAILDGEKEFSKCPFILFIGAPGSGKANLCRQLANRFEGVVHVSMGDIIRLAVAENENDQWTKEMNEAVEKGHLIDEKISCKLITNALDHLKGERLVCVLLEGFPRNLEQLDHLHRLNVNVTTAILLDCTEKFCEKNMRLKWKEVLTEEQMEEYVAQCIEMFKKNTLPLLKFFDEQKVLHLLEGDKGVDDLLTQTVSLIDSICGPLTEYRDESEAMPNVEVSKSDIVKDKKEQET